MQFPKLLLSLGWRLTGSLHGWEIIPFGQGGVLIIPSGLVCSSSGGTVHQYSQPGGRLFIQEAERLQALQDSHPPEGISFLRPHGGSGGERKQAHTEAYHVQAPCFV